MKLKRLFKVLYALRYLVMLFVFVLGVLITMHIWTGIEGSSVNYILVFYLTTEFIAGITYLIVMYRFNNRYEFTSGSNIRRKPIVNTQAKHRVIRDKKPSPCPVGEPGPEAPLKSHTKDDVEVKVEQTAYSVRVGNKVYEYTIYSDGRVYNRLTKRFIGYNIKGKKYFEAANSGVKRRFDVEKLIQQLFTKTIN